MSATPRPANYPSERSHSFPKNFTEGGLIVPSSGEVIHRERIANTTRGIAEFLRDRSRSIRIATKK
jgi:hypothetical protein